MNPSLRGIKCAIPKTHVAVSGRTPVFGRRARSGQALISGMPSARQRTPLMKFDCQRLRYVGSNRLSWYSNVFQYVGGCCLHASTELSTQYSHHQRSGGTDSSVKGRSYDRSAVSRVPRI